MEQIRKFKERVREIHKQHPYYLYLGVLFFGILIMIAAVILLVNVNENGASSQKNNTQQATETGILLVESRVPGQFMFNNEMYATPAKIEKIPEGRHSIMAHNSGYKDEEYTFTIHSGETSTIRLEMNELSTEEAIHQDEMKWIDYFNEEGQIEQKKIEERETKYPLTSSLPEVIGDVMFDYDVNDDGSVSYVVRALPGKTYIQADYQQQVFNFIQSKGINPNTIQITWTQ